MRQRSQLIGRRAVLLCLGALLFIFTGASLAVGQELFQPDGRLNQVAHFGGDAFYCVDDNFISTVNYPEMIDDGGFRLLNSSGQELWFVPAADILAAIEESVATNTTVIVAEGRGTYGPVRLYTYFDGKAQQFVFTGYDEYGKTNSLTFVPCTPVGPIPEEPGVGTAEELCTLIIPQLQQQSLKLTAPVKGVWPSTQIPCDECPPAPVIEKRLAFKRGSALLLIPNPYCLEDVELT